MIITKQEYDNLKLQHPGHWKQSIEVIDNLKYNCFWIKENSGCYYGIGINSDNYITTGDFSKLDYSTPKRTEPIKTISKPIPKVELFENVFF